MVSIFNLYLHDGTGRASESVGEEAAASLVTDIQSGGCVDSYLQDQVLDVCLTSH